MKPRRKGASTEAWRKKVEADPEWYRQNRKRSSLRRKAREAAQALGRPVREIYQQWGVA
ncbi:hypothetical protein [Microvirga arsenatis]|uniref:DUF3606 domain-containing protein n=1 Tax=Microvirga arsenatis TaxID=2692265 RepID=A0ABW9YUX5_9HYPH|nr:hypothetical protein [Microvirga arsenatis]NBJ13322.1 hypothetical protein [Microvirga arsenatis]NBJ24106.1 hypothetical protein [Microvirga arsenatis]